MRTEFLQNKRRFFPNLGKPGFTFYCFCGYRRLVFSRAVKPTSFPTNSGYIIFSFLCCFGCVFGFGGRGGVWFWGFLLVFFFLNERGLNFQQLG